MEIIDKKTGNYLREGAVVRAAGRNGLPPQFSRDHKIRMIGILEGVEPDGKIRVISGNQVFHSYPEDWGIRLR